MNKYNTELPKVTIPQIKVNYFSTRFFLGYLLVLCSIILAITLMYQAKYINPTTVVQQPEGGRVCAQVITSARNPISNQVQDFPTPCDVPPGWVIVPAEVNPR